MPKNPLSIILDDPIVAGAKSLGKRAVDYASSGNALRDSAALAMRVAPDLLRGGLPQVLQNQVATPMAMGMVEDFKANPGRTVAENLPVVGGVMSAMDAKELRQKAIEAKARGDMAAYRQYSEMAAAATGGLALGMLPVPGAAAAKPALKAGTKAVERAALRASATMPERAVAFATHEVIPGKVTGHLPNLVRVPTSAADAAQLQLERGAFSSDPRRLFRDPNSRDIVYNALGLEQAPMLEAQGMFKTEAGTEYNPAFVSRPRVKETPGGEDIAPEHRALLEAGEAYRAAVSGQAAGAYHKVLPEAPRELSGSLFTPLPEKQTQREIEGLANLGERYGLGDVVDTGQGVTMTSFYPEPPTGAETENYLANGLESAYSTLLPGAQPRAVGIASGYKGYENEWAQPHGSGAVTRQMLQYLEESGAPNALERLDTPEIRNQARTAMEADYEYAARTGQPVREDLQNLRRVIWERGPKALKDALSRKEFLPALTAALGLGAAVAGSAPYDSDE
ncbi:MAG: hypothetical protein RI988_3498 [Pseudomonadota bacterium]|jgi:hypothetical protein